MSEEVTRILIVEDQEDHAVLIRALVEEGLRDTVLAIDHVASGSEGLHRLEGDGYDICLLDYNLGEDIDGVAVLEEARNNGIDVPIVILTAAGNEAVAVRAMKAGAKDYLRKDALSPESLRFTVRHVLTLHREEVLRGQAQEELQRVKDELELKVKELDAANKQLLKLSRLKDDFVSSISHELRTPISNIKLSQQLVMAHPDARDTYLATLRRETERLYFIIEDLLNVARMALEPPSLNLVACDLNTLVLLYVADRMLLAQEHRLSLTFTERPDLPKVRADPMQLERVLGILLVNAFNYCPPGAEIQVRTCSQHVEDNLWIGFSVIDSGPGIPPDELPRLFERFFRGTAAREINVPGTGLGLSMAKDIVELHGGRIEVVSEGIPGKGAEFTVWLPAEEQEHSTRRPKQAERQNPKKGRRLQNAA